MNIFELIDELLTYGTNKNLIGKYDKIVAQNRILNILGLDFYNGSFSFENNKNFRDIHLILNDILSWSEENKKISSSINERDMLDTAIMGALTPSQTQLIELFNENYKHSPEKATKEFYKFSYDTNYIRRDRIEKNLNWISDTEYGNMEITINLSKPEKDPKDIEMERNAPTLNYPKCLICYENVGYYGRINQPARANHRVIPVTLSKEQWFFQYSPYVYYNEHAIVFSQEHRPMKISQETFQRLIEFLDFLPGYFIGSNADLPIVGGSILSHDHFQGGNYNFPMFSATVEEEIKLESYPGVKCEILKWPMSVIRLSGKVKNDIIELSNEIFEKWKIYSDENSNIEAFTDETPHNTVTPIAKKDGENYEMFIVLRNNRTTDEFPQGIFHPHNEVHHIKKENIGLIEVMGLAVLPGRLENEIENIIEILIFGEGPEKLKWNLELSKHYEWVKEIEEKYGILSLLNRDELDSIFKTEIGKKFSQVLEHAGVFKNDKDGRLAFKKFVELFSKAD